LKDQLIRGLVHKIETIFKFENAKNGLEYSEDNFEPTIEANIDSMPQFSLIGGRGNRTGGQYEEGDFKVSKKAAKAMPQERRKPSCCHGPRRPGAPSGGEYRALEVMIN
jgi:hypothetical protein